MQLKFIRKEIDTVEFFVSTETGKTGVSISGLGRLSGVSKQAISNRLKALSTKAVSKWLESLQGKDLTLSTNYSSSDLKARNITIVKSEVCALIITHYAFAGRLTAQLALIKFSAIGIDRWIKEIVEYEQRDPELPKQLLVAIHCEQIYQRLEKFNPRMAQMLVDDLGNSILQRALPDNPERWLGVMEIAKSMGYWIPFNYRASLGRYVAHRCADVAKEEQRLVNGQFRVCKLYPLNNSFVRGAITEYVRVKNLVG